MTKLVPFDPNLRLDGSASSLLHQLVFDMLLVTDGRTTELLETILHEKVGVTVVRQERREGAPGAVPAPYYIRESVLTGERSGFPVSHNIAIVYAEHVPPALFESIAIKQDGIGKAIGAFGLRTFRRVLDAGAVDAGAAVDLFGQPLTLRFANASGRVHYKKYAIHFELEPGIILLEYYHPELVLQRLKQAKLPEE